MLSSHPKEWKLLHPAPDALPRLMSRDNLTIHFSLDAPRYPDTYIERLSEHYRAYLRDNFAQGGPRITNRAKFVLSQTVSRGDNLSLWLRTEPYSQYLSLRSDPELYSWALRAASSEGLEPHSFLPTVLGNVGIVVTSDSKVLTIKRSKAVSTYVGYIDLPGGHPEPEEMPGGFKTGSETEIIGELFRSVQREVAEDIGGTPDDLGEPALVSILENVPDVQKPDMVFLFRVSMNSTDAREQFRDSPHSEVDQLRFVDLADTSPSEFESQMTPVARGSLVVLSHLRDLGLL